MSLIRFPIAVIAMLALASSAPVAASIWDSVPDETVEALGLTRDASTADLYQGLTKRYKENLTKGKYADWWEPIPLDTYLAPTLFYEPPQNLKLEVKRDQCVQCHTELTHGWVKSWQKSAHANLDEVRALPDDDPRAYKKGMIAEVEENLRAQGILDGEEKLAEVSCVDCHMGVGVEGGNHAEALRMPDRAVCGQCHVRQFAEAESELDTQVWPQDQWAPGHPSHAVDFMANVELATWAALPQREVGASCTLCHNNQTKCDTCHTRHEFSPVEARKPQACATCHNGVDHNEYEQYMYSKHGTVYQALGDDWNFDTPLAAAVSEGGMTAPTCAFCHFEYKGEFTHNVTRKVRWGFLPFKSIVDNLDHPWFEKRKDAWQGTCQTCHSPRFSKTYLDLADDGIKDGVDLVEETREVVQGLYDEGLLVGQKTNRPAPPEPVEEGPGAFSSLFMSEGNNPTMVDRTFAEMWEQHIARFMKGLQHVNPGGWTYSHGWSDLIKDQTFINEQATKLRQQSDMESRIGKLEESMGSAFNNRDADGRRVAALGERTYLSAGLGIIGGGLLIGGLFSLRRCGRRTRTD
ncbi:MAG: hydroxylamine reductase [Proteobacteria bacterium]|nr:MAG: hydroxylamine reductase [Pseudomonadota bacterium]